MTLFIVLAWLHGIVVGGVMVVGIRDGQIAAICRRYRKLFSDHEYMRRQLREGPSGPYRKQGR